MEEKSKLEGRAVSCAPKGHASSCGEVGQMVEESQCGARKTFTPTTIRFEPSGVFLVP